ncbi:MAG: hypothetical protein M3282_03615 [Gemmatimonadota bacterium]|nr:hypothetical protein [Gemmatimonadota bacterium]
MRCYYLLVLGGLAAAGCGETGEGEPGPQRGAEAAAGGPARACDAGQLAPTPGTQRVVVYFACAGGAPGQLYPVFRPVSDTVPAVEAVLAELLRGPTDAERERGFRFYFSPATADALRQVRTSAKGDTLHVDFADLPGRLPDTPDVKSFLPPGVMADLIWAWLGGPPQVFTRTDWEQI